MSCQAIYYFQTYDNIKDISITITHLLIFPNFQILAECILSYLLIPWSSLSLEANSSSTIQEISCILWNPKVH
jgi:hypothetical protein